MQMHPDATICKIALSMIPWITADIVRGMESAGITPQDFFTMEIGELKRNLGSNRIDDSERESALQKARKENEFVERHSIHVLFLLDEEYPMNLREIPDAPVVLYVLGNPDLAGTRMLSMVGTRRCTNYGIGFCRWILESLRPYCPQLKVVSGLAYGIDAAAHQSALDNEMKTIAVVAHGLDMIYPSQNRDLARRILAEGGAIVSEYPSGVRPFRNNFLQRNRIVAGLTMLTIVVESEIKGGAMATANQAFSYSREVMAVPGRYNDLASQGCNYLIYKLKASIFSGIPELLSLMGWNEVAGLQLPKERTLFPELDGDAKLIYDAVKKKSSPITADEICRLTGIPMNRVMSSITELEFDGIISRLPGGRYE